MKLNLPFLTTLLVGSTLAASTLAQPIELNANKQHVSIVPETLQIDWNGLSINDNALSINQQTSSSYRLIKKSATYASWQVQPSGIQLQASLEGEVLQLTLTPPNNLKIDRKHPLVIGWFELNEQKVDTLLLPLSEGMRIPVKHATWANFLADEYSGSNTTQGLKMPFWSAEQQGRFINYHLLSPTNNQLSFSNHKGRVDMALNHHFTPLNRNQPLRVNISIGDDILSGAKQYRTWRQTQRLADPLSAKIARNPEIKKLIAANHVYLFGIGPISIQDVKNWWGLNEWYTKRSGLILSREAEKELSSLSKDQGWFSAFHKQLLLDELQSSLTKKFPVPHPSLIDNTIATQYQMAQARKSWLIKQAGQYLVKPSKWGQALSSDMLNTFQQAGLTHLWLGFDNWMPSFYQPESVNKAKQLGYLVGVYDSYNTAIAQGVNDGWITALLPDEMRNDCAIEKANGDKKTGFRGKGFYLNPNCHLDYVKQRVLDIAHYGGFNSLFLDVDGTSMAREDYRDNSSQTEVLSAYNKRLNWISQQTPLVLGSEDGNALTSTGMAFAHGLETVGFGWVDPDMTKIKQSKYYLGRWYPNHKPEYFFKSAQVKEPYRSLLFSPQYRLPLYQAVFHDEVINNHHWHSDSLKFSDVKAYRDLTAMLYNTPAMVHLTRDEALSVNSPRIKALQHYQAGYSPLHKALWDKALTDFVWLNPLGTVQKATYSDGSIIVANFTQQRVKYGDKHIDPLAIYAELSDGTRLDWQSQ